MSKAAQILFLFAVILFLTGCGGNPVISFETVTENLTVTPLSVEEDKGVDGIYVAVNGAVVNPGVYILKPGTRVCDAINAAGGLKENADVSNLNLVNIIADGTSITVCERKEESLNESTTSGSSVRIPGKDLVNINTATVSELTKLSGIGEAKAKAIVAYREANGTFNNIEDLKKVSGIKDGTFEKIKDSITLY